MREREVLLPGVTTLARMVARAGAETDERLWETLSGSAGVEPARVLDLLLEVPEGTLASIARRLPR